MVFCGMAKLSMVDYPGLLCSVLFAEGCNFKCPYCHNPSAVRGSRKERYSLEHIKPFIDSKVGLCDAFVISGGEPTLKDTLPDVCEKLKSRGFKIKIDTNGSRPDMVRQLIADKLVDYLAVDVKGEITREGYSVFSSEEDVHLKVKETVGMLMARNRPGLDYEFRTVCARPFVNDRMIATLSEQLALAKRYRLLPLNKYAEDTLDSRYSDKANKLGFEPIDMERLMGVVARARSTSRSKYKK